MQSSPWRKYKMLSHIFKKWCDLCTLEGNGLRTGLEAFATHPFPASRAFQIGSTLLIPPAFQNRQVLFWISFHILSFLKNYYCKYYFVLFNFFFFFYCQKQATKSSDLLMLGLHVYKWGEFPGHLSTWAEPGAGGTRAALVMPHISLCPGLKCLLSCIIHRLLQWVLLPSLNLIQRESQGHNDVCVTWTKPAHCCCLA